MKFNNSTPPQEQTASQNQGGNHLVLTIDGVSKYFGNKKLDGFMVLDDVDMEIEKNKITAIIGSNGAGKTTLFNIISGFLRPDSGKIIYHPNGNDYVLDQLPAHRISNLGVGRLFQDSHLFPNLSIMDNMIIAGQVSLTEGVLNSIVKRSSLKKENTKREERALNLFKSIFGEEDDPFSYRKNHYANTLSFGQQRLLAILRLFIGKYDLLLLDEPTAGVNVEIIKKMVEIIKSMPQKGYSVLLIEHNWEFVLEVADFCYFLDEGEVAAFGTPADVLGNRKVRERYLGR